MHLSMRKPVHIRCLAIAMAMSLAGCGMIAVHRQAHVVPLNGVATAIGIPTIEMILYGTGFGPVIARMPSGETLQGQYRLAIGGAVTTGFGSAYGTGGAAFGSGTSISTAMNNPFTAQATGDRGSVMVCQGTAGGGHGDCLCTLNGTARYQMVF